MIMSPDSKIWLITGMFHRISPTTRKHPLPRGAPRVPTIWDAAHKAEGPRACAVVSKPSNFVIFFARHFLRTRSRARPAGPRARRSCHRDVTSARRSRGTTTVRRGALVPGRRMEERRQAPAARARRVGAVRGGAEAGRGGDRGVGSRGRVGEQRGYGRTCVWAVRGTWVRAFCSD